MTETGATAVVVGASGGIGSAILHRLFDDAQYSRVVAVARRQPAACPAQDWIEADIQEEASLARAAASLSGTPPLTRVIVATGRLGPAPEKTMRAMDSKAMLDLFAINAVGPALVAKHLLPLMPRDRPHVFAAISARVGSIGDNRLGGWYSYRASKAALNMLVRTLAIEHQRTHKLGICVALHPGTVDTGLSAPFQGNVPDLFTPEKSAMALLRVINGLQPSANGGFFAWDGSAIPW